MDLSEALVDLLLVRLGREEEKQRVIELLVSELHMSREAARASVDKAPTVLLEAVPMGQARVIQNRLYPFVDLLPRMETVTDQAEGLRSDNLEDDSEESQSVEAAPGPSTRPAAPVKSEELPAPTQVERDAEKLSFTSASEEVLSIERCHVCGRTPTSVEKLAPCRSCAELTCRDCFDRIAHVCQKCAADGKVMDTPLGRTSSEKPGSRHGNDTSIQYDKPKTSSPLSKNAIYVIAGFLVIALLAAFYFVDPLKVFHSPGSAPAPDTSTVTVMDSISTDPITTGPDTLTVPDSAQAATENGELRLSNLSLPQGADSLTDFLSVAMEVDAPDGITPMADESELLAEDIARISASVPILIDRFGLFRFQDSTVVFAVSILHPEEDTARYELLRNLGTWLEPSGIDELVFYYSENEYYPVRTVSFVSADLAELSGCIGPVDFQNCTSTSSDLVWGILTGQLQDWMARY